MSRSRQARHNQSVRRSRREAGLCVDCGVPSERYRCTPCARRHAAWDTGSAERAKRHRQRG